MKAKRRQKVLSLFFKSFFSLLSFFSRGAAARKHDNWNWKSKKRWLSLMKKNAKNIFIFLSDNFSRALHSVCTIIHIEWLWGIFEDNKRHHNYNYDYYTKKKPLKRKNFFYLLGFPLRNVIKSDRDRWTINQRAKWWWMVISCMWHSTDGYFFIISAMKISEKKCWSFTTRIIS